MRQPHRCGIQRADGPLALGRRLLQLAGSPRGVAGDDHRDALRRRDDDPAAPRATGRREEADARQQLPTRAVATSNAVESGIAAAGTICGQRLGTRSDSPRHADAVALLERAALRRRAAASAVRGLLDVKSRAQYGDGEFSASLAAANLSRARTIDEVMEQILAEA